MTAQRGGKSVLENSPLFIRHKVFQYGIVFLFGDFISMA